MARAKKRKTADRPKSSRRRARKDNGRAPAVSAASAPKNSARSKTADSKAAIAKPAVAKSAAAKSSGSKPATAKAEAAKSPSKRPASATASSRDVAVGSRVLPNAQGQKGATVAGEAPRSVGRARKREGLDSAAKGARSTPQTPGTPALSKPLRAVDPSATKWTGDVIRVPPLPKGQKVKSNRSKPSPRSNGRNSATEHDPIQFPEESVAVPRTMLTDAQLREFKELLLHKRAELCGDVVRLTDEALHRASGGVNDQSSMPIHMADLGTDNWEQEFTLGLIANEQAVVREIDQALERIFAKTYGVCVATHVPIGLARLRAKPWAKYCIEYARAREEGRAN